VRDRRREEEEDEEVKISGKDDDEIAAAAARYVEGWNAVNEKVRYISHWSPYDRVGVVNADP
jgi:hypothetical protein